MRTQAFSAAATAARHPEIRIGYGTTRLGPIDSPRTHMPSATPRSVKIPVTRVVGTIEPLNMLVMAF